MRRAAPATPGRAGPRTRVAVRNPLHFTEGCQAREEQRQENVLVIKEKWSRFVRGNGRGVHCAVAMVALVIGLASACEVRSGEPGAKIKNPFYERPAWRLWTEDQTPVPYSSPKDPRDRREPKDQAVVKQQFAPPPAKDRKYPDFSQGPQGPAGLPILRTFEQAPEIAGFWDDCYATLDFAHTRMQEGWSDGRGSGISLRGQFINVDYGFAVDATARLPLGVNFTSQSFANRGRHIVDDFANNDDTERNFFFANCIRATPAHISYEDKFPEKCPDLYDGLFGHSYQSIGQSGSETPALLKMMLAGGCMPRATKDLLKRHGAYAAALLTLFKQALPYADAEGHEVPFENELRHRPAYCSSGDIPHPHYCPANPYYHAYDETAHLRRMIELARDMKAAPPVAVLKLLDLTVEKDAKKLVSAVTNDDRIKSLNKTILRVWGNPGETLHVHIDARESYDLQDRPLTYECRAVYPHQRNVSIEPLAERGVYRISVRHDPKLPKGRIPVVLVARNGTQVPSNPVFVNFYWPEENELDDYSHGNRDRRSKEKPDEPKKLRTYDVMRNLRPAFETGLPHDTICARPGETVSFAVRATDPEGFPVAFYRWSGEVGHLRGDRFTFDVPKDDPGRMYPVHLICSDGTGAYTGRLIKILVSAQANTLPEGWSATACGELEAAGSVQHNGGEFRFSGVGAQVRGRENAGRFAFRKVSGDFDMMCRVREVRIEGRAAASAKFGLMVRDRVDDLARYGFVDAVSSVASDRPPSARWEGRKGASSSHSRRETDKQLATPTSYLRLVRRGANVAAYTSGDGSTWEQISVDTDESGKEAVAGLMLSIENAGPRGEVCRAEGRCEWIPPSAAKGLPVLSVKGQTKGRGYAAPAQLEIVPAGADANVRYTLDGREPTDRSENYAAPLKLDKAGRIEVRARGFEGDKAGDTAVAVVYVESP
jgi:hypothetical protein